MEPFRWLVRLSSGRQRNGHSHARPDSPIEKGSPPPRPSPICLSLSPFLPPSFAVWTSRAPAPRMSSWAGGKEGRRERPDGGRTDGPSHSTSEMARCTAFLPQVRRSRTFNGRRRREGGSNFPVQHHLLKARAKQQMLDQCLAVNSSPVSETSMKLILISD